MRVGLRRLVLVPFLGFFCAASFPLIAQTVYSASGSANVNTTVVSFRTALGPLNPNTAGSAGSGRREINWDGVPDALATPNNLPFNFFNVNSPRGTVFSTPGTAVQVSANSGVTTTKFGNINATYPAQFTTLSAQRLFTAIGSNVLDVTFFVPGSTTPANVTGFGAAFTDVDVASTSSIQFFDSAGTSLGTYFVPAAPTDLSFVGVIFSTASVGRVRITSGNAALGPNDSPPATDVVVMDDFIYGEPVAANVAPVLQGSVLRKVHGAAGPFDLTLSPVLTAPTTEPRAGPAHQLVFTYDKPLNAAIAAVTEGVAGISSTIVGSTVVVNLSGVTNAQYVTVSLTGIGSTDGGAGGTGTVRVGLLEGDVSQNRIVTVADLGQVNAQLAQPLTAANFLKDVNASGALTVADKGLTNAKLTTSLPAP